MADRGTNAAEGKPARLLSDDAHRAPEDPRLNAPRASGRAPGRWSYSRAAAVGLICGVIAAIALFVMFQRSHEADLASGRAFAGVGAALGALAVAVASAIAVALAAIWAVVRRSSVAVGILVFGVSVPVTLFIVYTLRALLD
jgi:hypothetical protein